MKHVLYGHSEFDYHVALDQAAGTEVQRPVR